MNKEEMIRLRWRAITGNLTEEDLNKLNALNIKTTSLENTQEIKLNDNNDTNKQISHTINKNIFFIFTPPFYNASTSNSTSKQLVKSNGKSLLEKDNNNNYGMSNVIFLATISFVVEISFLLISMFLFK